MIELILNVFTHLHILKITDKNSLETKENREKEYNIDLLILSLPYFHLIYSFFIKINRNFFIRLLEV